MAKIIVVDDSLFMRQMIVDILVKDGHTVIAEAENAKTALELYKKLIPDLMTMDIVMPEVDGVNTLKAVREILAFDKEAIIVIVSALVQQDMVAESIRAGAKDFIVKPFQKSRISETVNRLIKR